MPLRHRPFNRGNPAVRVVRNEEDGSVEILIYDVIDPFWGIRAIDIRQQLKDITASTIHVRINSPGGDAFEGLAIYNTLREHPAHVVAHIDGMAASIASVVALAGDDIIIAENAFVMIHHPWAFTVGNANDHRLMADRLDKIGESIVQTYVKRADQDRDQIVDWMDQETWFNADEAIEAGFADRKAEDDEAPEEAADTEAFDLSCYRQAPAALSRSMKQQQKERERALREEGMSRRGAKVAARSAGWASAATRTTAFLQHTTVAPVDSVAATKAGLQTLLGRL